MNVKITCEIDLKNHPTFNNQNKNINNENIFDVFRSVILVKNYWITKSMANEKRYEDENNIEGIELEKHRQFQYKEDIKFMEDFIKNLKMKFE